MTLDPSGNIRLTDIVYPIGCLSTLVVTEPGEYNGTMSVKDYLLSQYQLKPEWSIKNDNIIIEALWFKIVVKL